LRRLLPFLFTQRVLVVTLNSLPKMSDTEDNIQFSSPEEEGQYWKTKCKAKVKELKELEETFNEFQDSSKDLEKEMEREIERSEKQVKETTSNFRKLKDEFEEFKEKSRRTAEDSGRMIHNLQEDSEKIKKVKRELEMEKQKVEEENDNLERREREANASIHDLTDKLNKLMEETAWLTTELEEQKQKTMEIIQRNKDEIRDLRLELALLSDRATPVTKASTSKTSATSSTAVAGGNGVATNPVISNLIVTSNGTTYSRRGSIGLVDDMLMLVKDMEKRLSISASSKRELSTAPNSSSLNNNSNDSPKVVNRKMNEI